jgi:lipopolysaccharide export system protein LptA
MIAMPLPSFFISRFFARSSRLGATLLVASIGILGGNPKAFAERADKEKPAVITADKNDIDELNNVQLYTGDVELTKGTIILRADQLTTKQDPEGYNFGVAVSTQPNKLAYFKQKREGVDEYIEGRAERIEYDEKSDTVKLFNRAIVKRLAAGRDADEIRGDRIDYNTRTERSTALSSETSPIGSNDHRRQTTTVIQPKIKPGTSSAPGSDTAIAPPVSSPPIDLKRESSIESAPRQ